MRHPLTATFAPLLLALGCALSTPSWASDAAENQLTLYGATLASVSIADFQASAREAGARSKGRQGVSESFDVALLGMPSVRSMVATYANGKVMTVQYELGHPHEKLRKMLAAKYGMPHAGPAGFTNEHATDGTYTWRFAGGMRLVFKKPFIGTVSLSYVNEPLLAELERRAHQAADRDAAEKANSKTHLF